MQLNPIFPNRVSKSRTTPTLIGMVVFCGMTKKILKNRKRRKTGLGEHLVMFEYLERVATQGMRKKKLVYKW